MFRSLEGARPVPTVPDTSISVPLPKPRPSDANLLIAASQMNDMGRLIPEDQTPYGKFKGMQPSKESMKEDAPWGIEYAVQHNKEFIERQMKIGVEEDSDKTETEAIISQPRSRNRVGK